MQTITDDMISRAAKVSPGDRKVVQKADARENKIVYRVGVAVAIVTAVLAEIYGIVFVANNASEAAPYGLGVFLITVLALSVGAFMGVIGGAFAGGYFYTRQFKRGTVHKNANKMWDNLAIWLRDSFNVQVEGMTRAGYIDFVNYLLLRKRKIWGFKDIYGHEYLLRKIDDNTLDYIVVLRTESTFEGKELPQVVNAVAYTALDEGFRIDDKGNVRIGDMVFGGKREPEQDCAFAELLALASQEDTVVPESISGVVKRFVERTNVLSGCALNNAERASFRRIHDELDVLANATLLLVPVGFDEEAEAKAVDGFTRLIAAVDSVIESYTNSVKDDLNNVVAVQKAVFGSEESDVEDDISEKGSVTS